jgi:Protein of unknown function (DUF3634)
MNLLAGLLILVLLSIPLFMAIKRATELFRITVEQGQARHVRGRIPRPLLSDIEDIVARPRVTSAEIRVVTAQGRPEVHVSGKLTADQVQRLRNVVGKFQVAQIRAGRPARGSR